MRSIIEAEAPLQNLFSLIKLYGIKKADHFEGKISPQVCMLLPL